TAETQKVTVPNVMGINAQEANRTILNTGLNIKIDAENLKGDNKIVSYQFPQAGEQVDIGSVVEIKCKEQGTKKEE
ncbi:MAG: PASTA domain-containing protein, partial [Oscillospiraceae bacterium]